MDSIRKRRNLYALLLSVSILLALLLGAIISRQAALFFAAASLITLFLLLRQSRLCSDAGLIRDNRILQVPAALISIENSHTKRPCEETIVSTFGILIGSDIYRWGLKGIHGIRLHSVEIDRERMHLTFGDKSQIMNLDLLHGLTRKEAVQDAAEKLWRETGVRADISGWQEISET
ncbi:MAG: hypothetical protein PHR78_06535 [Eubacteriales bacterium]|nr:hypothetical protein [Eubacteriales bacterium]MDD4324700.1 hypothetical protein [Eubacteriales bacterium]MDD4541795.1 hypothetical protein [Eubacteriales bacterium]